MRLFLSMTLRTICIVVVNSEVKRLLRFASERKLKYFNDQQ